MEQKVAKLSKEIVDQLPSFVRQDHQTFIAFLEAYYAYMEQEGKTQYVIDNLKSYTDIDTTIDDFVDYFLAQYAFTLPRSVFESNTTESKRLFVKYTSTFYQSKGAETSYRLLFRLLYGEEISFFYPETVLFEPSSGKWVRRKTLKIENLDNLDVASFKGKKAISSTGATAIIDFASLYEENGFVLIELNSENDSLEGEFMIGDTITIDGIGTFTPLNTISSIEIINPGRGYTANTPLTIINGENAEAFIESVDAFGGITKIGLRVPGIGLDDANVSVIVPPPSKIINGTYELTDGVMIIKLNEKHGLSIGDNANVTFLSGGASGLSNVFQIEDTFGWNAFKFTITTPPADTTGNVEIDYNIPDWQANLVAHKGIITNYEGTYGRNFDGQLDHQIKLQDSRFYQKYSYVIRSNIGIDTWRDVVKSVLHPAGWAMFGELLISNEIGEESIYVGPVGNAIDSILTIVRNIINEAGAVYAGIESIAPMTNLGITNVYNALFGYVGLGSTRETLDKFKFDYEDTTIETFADFTIGFFTEESNVNLLYNIPPPSEIKFE